MDDSWDLTGYPIEFQCGYERLISLDVGVEVMHPGPYPNNTSEAVYSGLHRYLAELPRFFLNFVENAEEHFARSAEGKGKARGGMNRMLKFKLFMEQQLDIHEAQEILWNTTSSIGDTLPPISQVAAPLIEAEGMTEDDVAMEDSEGTSGEDSGQSTRQIEPSSGPIRYHFAHGTPTSPLNMPASPRTAHPTPLSSFIEKLRALPSDSPQVSCILAQRSTSSTSNHSHHSFATALSSNEDLEETPLTSLDEVVSNPFKVLDPVSIPVLKDTMAPPVKQDMPVASVPVDERFVYITKPCQYEAMIQARDISFDIRWRFERALAGRSSMTWDDVTIEDLNQLKGKSVDVAPRLDLILQNIATRKSGVAGSIEKAIWSNFASDRHIRLLNEIDREEESIRCGDLQGLGLVPSLDWPYGGKISYSIAVRPLAPLRKGKGNDKGKTLDHTTPLDIPELSFRMELQLPEMSGKSFRLARRFGSRRVITFRLHRDIRDKARAMDFFRGRIFVIFGRAYRALWSPPDSDNVLAIETNDSIPGIVPPKLDPPMPSFIDLTSMFSGIDARPTQAMVKWAARSQLLFSDSVPGAVVQDTAIDFIADIFTQEARNSDRPSTEQILTDGCGLMSEELAGRIFSHPSLRFESGRPCVLQVRIGGSKGLLALMSPEQQTLYQGKDIVIRSSMLKSIPAMQHASDPSHFVVDVVRAELLRLGTFLSSEPIIVMADRGVPMETIITMGMQSLEELEKLFTPFPQGAETSTDVLKRIHAACYRQGGVGRARQKRLFSASGRSAKVAGLQREASISEISDVDTIGDGVELLSSSERYEVDPISGQPGSIAEALMEAVAAGFNPIDSYFTCNKLHFAMKQLLDSSVRQMKFRVEASCSAFIVPDSLGVLAPNEIYIRFSKDLPVDPVTKCPMTHLMGDVLVFRSPCKLPTDVRKFRAVYKMELAHLTDCVVMSAHPSCTRSPASFLGGGDYDGDIVQVFWDKALVEPFQNAPDHMASAPKDFEERYFEKETLTCGSFLETMQGQDLETQIASMQHFLLGALLDEKHTGIYSRLHANAVYTHGLGDPQTMDLARIFCLVLDARKSGLRLRDGILPLHRKEHQGFLGWMAARKGEENRGERRLQCPPHLSPFVMDVFQRCADQKSSEIMGRFLKEIPSERMSKADFLALSKPWISIEAAARAQANPIDVDLAKLRAHVNVCYRIYQLIRSSSVDRYQSIPRLYDDFLLEQGSPPHTPTNGGTPRSHPGTRHRRNASPIKQVSKEDMDENNIIVVTQLRRLAEVWRDRLTPVDVPICSWGSEAQLARLKVGLGATMAKFQPKQKFTFEMDFYTTRVLKTESLGGKMGIVPALYDSLKPGWKAGGEI